MSFVLYGVSLFLKSVLKNDVCVSIHKLEEIWGKNMGNVLANTLWEMLKVDVLTKDAKQKEQIEKIKDIIKKEKNDC